MNSTLYQMESLCDSSLVNDADSFIFVYENEKRSTHCLEHLATRCNVEKIIVLVYEKKAIADDVLNILSAYRFSVLDIPDTSIGFLRLLIDQGNGFWGSKSILDISCLKIPELYPLIKYFKLNIRDVQLMLTYSIPFEYHFADKPFTSYQSYIGDLTNHELLGFSGIGDDYSREDLIVFMGFEGALSLKVVENTYYKDLVLVNSLPSYYQKYKDYSVLNNYSLIPGGSKKFFYTPANNPFETYNLLEELIRDKKGACIAPLSTKLVALGACLYAIEHENIRVVYPTSSRYFPVSTHDVYKAFVYTFP